MSPPPYDSLNVSCHVGDNPELVSANVQMIRKTVGAGILIKMGQPHGKEIALIKDYPDSDCVVDFADAVITNRTGIGLMVRQADCQAVIVFDPENRVVANIHCGWRGNVKNIIGKVIDIMCRDYGCKRHQLIAAVSPSLGPCCAEFKDYTQIFPRSFDRFRLGKDHFNLWAISAMQLEYAGLLTERIEVARMCNRCNRDLFYSYRSDKITGRSATVVMLSD